MQRQLITLSPLFLLLGACSSMKGSRGVDDVQVDRRVETGLLQSIPEDSRGNVGEETEKLLAARDRHAAAVRTAQRSEDERELAEKELGIAKARLERADASVKVAERGTREELETAQRERGEVAAIVVAAERRIELRERQLVRARARQELAREQHELAMARVELAKAEAIDALEEPLAKPIDVEAFRSQVRQQEEDVGIAEVRWEAARREVEATRSLYRESIQATPASYQKEWTDWDEKAAEREEQQLIQGDDRDDEKND